MKDDIQQVEVGEVYWPFQEAPNFQVKHPHLVAPPVKTGGSVSSLESREFVFCSKSLMKFFQIEPGLSKQSKWVRIDFLLGLKNPGDREPTTAE